ncbi:MAG: RDD family protein [Candidatus Xenobiia bacterium LiM19]
MYNDSASCGDIITPSSVNLERAPFWRRFLAFFIDISWQYVIICVLLIFLGRMNSPWGDRGDLSTAILAGLFFTVIKFFESFSVASSGQGLGRRIMGIRLISKKDTKLTPGRVFFHSWLELFVSYPLVFPSLRMLWDRERQMWHDKVTGTLAVTVDKCEEITEVQPLSSRMVTVAFSAIITSLAAGSMLILTGLPALEPYLELLKVIYGRNNSSFMNFFTPSLRWLFTSSDGRIILILLSACIIIAVISNTVIYWNRNDRNNIAFYWICGACTAFLMLMSTISLSLHAIAVPNAARANCSVLGFRLEVTAAIPESDIVRWKLFADKREQLIWQWKNGNPGKKLEIAEKWSRYLDSGIKKGYFFPESFSPQEGKESRLPAMSGSQATVAVMKGRDGRVEAFMEIKEDTDCIAVSSLKVAPWNDFNSNRTLSLRILIKALREVSILSGDRGMKGNVATTSDIIDSMTGMESYDGPSQVIVFKDRLLEGLWFPRGVLDERSR